MLLFLWIALWVAEAPLSQAVQHKPECRRVFNQKLGQLDPADYEPSDNCIWVIKCGGVHLAQFTLHQVNITQSHDCSTDYLEVIDGSTLDGKVLMHWCGTELPERSTITSLSNSMIVRLKSNSSQHDNTFKASFQQVCGAVIHVSDGYFHQDQVFYFNCTWTVLAENSNQHITIGFNIYVPDRVAGKTYLDVWEGTDNTGQHLLRSSAHECDGKRRVQAMSRGPAMHLRIVVPSGVLPIFYASYNTTPSACGEVLDVNPDQDGELDSTRYNLTDDCVWIIDSTALRVPVEFVLHELNVSQSLHAVATQPSGNCLTDYLEVIDGPTPDGKVLMHVCGSPLPEHRIVTSRGYTMTVRLKSISPVHSNHFRASYALRCGAVITVLDETTSPRRLSHHGSNCSWTLVTENPSQHVHLEQFLIEPSSCDKDTAETYVDLWDGVDSTGEHRVRYSVGGVYDVTSLGNALHLRLVTPRGATVTAIYSVLNDTCGDIIFFHQGADKDEVKAQNTVVRYRGDCVWSVWTVMGHSLRFTLQQVNIAPSLDCSTDFLEVIDGFALDGEVLMHRCGSQRGGNRSQLPEPSTVTSLSGIITVRLNTTRRGNRFVASYYDVCGGIITVSGGSNFLHSALDDSVAVTPICTWTLKAQHSNQSIILSELMLQDEDKSVDEKCEKWNCERCGAHVEVWERRLDNTSWLRERFCAGSGAEVMSAPGAVLTVTLISPPTIRSQLVFIEYNVLDNEPTTSPEAQINVGTILGCILAVVAAATAAHLWMRFQKDKEEYQLRFEKGNIENILPAHCIGELAEYLPYDKIFEIGMDQLRIGDILGMGAFGVVRKAEASNIVPGEPEATVAVKMVHRNRRNRSAVKALVSELKIMVHLGKHLNVVNLLGAHTADLNNILVVVEYCKHGNLCKYLSNHRRDFIDEINVQTGAVEPSKDVANMGAPLGCCTSDLVRYAFQVAHGMEFLGTRNVIHGDLAARNVLLGDDNIVKICDFGLSKIIQNDQRQDENQVKESVLLPLKWMAIESISEGKFTKESDAWSYGVFLWELFSLALSPYEGVPVTGFLQRLKTGYRMEKPRFATDQVYEVMLNCWKENVLHRPNFPQLVQLIGSMMDEGDRQMYVEKNKLYDSVNLSRQNEAGYYDYLQIIGPSSCYVSLKLPTYANVVFIKETRCPGHHTSHLNNTRKKIGRHKRGTKIRLGWKHALEALQKSVPHKVT